MNIKSDQIGQVGTCYFNMSLQIGKIGDWIFAYVCVGSLSKT